MHETVKVRHLMRPYLSEMTARGFLVMVVLGCGFWALVIYHDVEARDVADNISRIRFPPQREGLLLRLHSHRIDSAFLYRAGKIRLRATQAELRAEQRTHKASADVLNTDDTRPADSRKPFTLPSAHYMRNVQVAKAQLGHTSVPRDLLFSKGNPAIYLAKVQQGVGEASTDGFESTSERLYRQLWKQ